MHTAPLMRNINHDLDLKEGKKKTNSNEILNKIITFFAILAFKWNFLVFVFEYFVLYSIEQFVLLN